jgi:histidinol-phosphate aminotransferase
MENKPDAKRFWNDKTRQLTPYVPGEQPRDQAYIKLNTNECPYPPADEVVRAIREYPADRVRLYPDPASLRLRQCLGNYFGRDESCIFVGNGSDEILAIAFQAFFNSRPDLAKARGTVLDALPPSECIVFPDITYSFYPVYARFYDIPYRQVSLDEEFRLPVNDCLEPSAGLVLANPNAPTGIAASLSDIAAIAAADRSRLVMVDEAYVDFSGGSAVSLLDDYDNILVIQTCSKSRALAGLRVGYAIGAPELVEGLERVRDSFNSYTLDSLAQTAAIAAFGAAGWFERTRGKIMATREKTSSRLEGLGFRVLPSSANFLFASHPGLPGADLYRKLKEAGILVRHFQLPRIENFVRITIGTDENMERLADKLAELL